MLRVEGVGEGDLGVEVDQVQQSDDTVGDLLEGQLLTLGVQAHGTALQKRVRLKRKKVDCSYTWTNIS